ncbi:MAG: glycosyltransferase family 2 protein [Alphaproteobacteria bacterium]|nr:glycosyltransferase family 2 protein [Alphaproteobacteria bacterium]MDD9920654.1 glycosyltransferase family 2 protein [Alphaproteobacteria bacterium]
MAEAKQISPFFSIVIPVYNRAGRIGPTLKSCLEQTFQDFEIILVDDGSSDNLEEVINTYNDDRLRYIYQENAGGGAARNTGMLAAKGQYIALLDSDDMYFPEKLQKAYDFLTENSTFNVLYTPIQIDRGVGKYWVKPSRGIYENEHVADYLMRRRGWTPISTVVVEKNLAQKVLFNPEVVYGDDTDFAIRLYLAGGKFYMGEEALTSYTDMFSADRLSSASGALADFDIWLDLLKPDIPRKAYYGYFGWHVAKKIVGQKPFLAFWLFFKALFMGAYSPKMAAVVFSQVFLPRALYRQVADYIAKMFGK